MKNYITQKQQNKHNQYLALKSVLSAHGIVKEKEIAELIGLTPQAWYKRTRGKKLELSVIELRDIAIKLELTSEEINYIVQGV